MKKNVFFQTKRLCAYTYKTTECSHRSSWFYFSLTQKCVYPKIRVHFLVIPIAFAFYTDFSQYVWHLAIKWMRTSHSIKLKSSSDTRTVSQFLWFNSSPRPYINISTEHCSAYLDSLLPNTNIQFRLVFEMIRVMSWERMRLNDDAMSSVLCGACL